MHIYTKEKISLALRETGRQLTLDDVEDIVELDRLAAKIHGIGGVADTLDDYFCLGGHWYTTPTPARVEALDKIAKAHRFTGMTAWGLMWCLDLDTPLEDLKRVPSYSDLHKYSKKVDATRKEVANCIRNMTAKLTDGEEVDTIDDEVERDTSDKSKKGVWYACCIMAREIGGSPEFWYNAPSSAWAAGLQAANDKIEAEIRSINKSAKGNKMPPIPTPKLRVIKEFNDKLAAMKERWSMEPSVVKEAE